MIRIISVVSLVLIGFTCAQLDIPNAQHSTESPTQKGLKVVVLPNSYANNEEQPKSETNNNFDSDRSQRYGKKFKSITKLIII